MQGSLDVHGGSWGQLCELEAWLLKGQGWLLDALYLGFHMRVCLKTGLQG